MADWQALAQEAGQKLSLPWEWIYGQWAFESGNFNSFQTNNYNNAAGIKAYSPSQAQDSEGWRIFSDPTEFMNEYVSTIKAYRSDGVFNSSSVDDFVGALGNGGYFGTDDPTAYLNGVKSHINLIGVTPSVVTPTPVSNNQPFNWLTGIFNGVTGNAFSTSNPIVGKSGVSSTATNNNAFLSSALNKVLVFVVGLVVVVSGMFLIGSNNKMIIEKEGN